MNIKFSDKLSCIIDVTKPPYNLDNTGKNDCTDTLIKIINDYLSENISAVKKSMKDLDDLNDKNGRLEVEIYNMRKGYHIPFPRVYSAVKIIYFPKGTYLISDTITHSLQDLYGYQNGTKTMELSSRIHFVGESMEEVCIKLSDNNSAFKYGS